MVASIRAQARRSVTRISPDSWSRRSRVGKASGRARRGCECRQPSDGPAGRARRCRASRYEVDAILVAPFHDLGAAVMAVGADGDPGLWPMLPYATDQAAQVTADLG